LPMLESFPGGDASLLAEWTLTGTLNMVKNIAMIFIGFSMVIFVHEPGHFLVAKWAGVRVEKFAIGFGKELIGFTRGETRYSFNLLPLGGFVKMLGQEDFTVDKSGEWTVKQDPRAFTSKSVGHRMAIVSAGVIMNVIFAALLFMIVFMMGLEVLDNEVGVVLPGSRADLAGLRAGDRVLRIDGKPIGEFVDIKIAVMLAKPDRPLKFRIERNGEELEIPIIPRRNEEENVLQIGIGSPTTRQLLRVDAQPGIPDEMQLKPDDEIISVGSHVNPDSFTLFLTILEGRGEPVSMMVRRSDPENPGATIDVECQRRGRLVFQFGGAPQNRTGSLLGLVPRRKIPQVLPESPAETAPHPSSCPGCQGAERGFKVGDVILRWGDIEHPTFEECRGIIHKSESRDIPVRVLRGEKAHELLVRPEAKRKLLFRKELPMVGLSFEGPEEDQVVVATTIDVLNGSATPAASLRTKDGSVVEIPRGSVILAVDDQPVSTWYELVEQFRAKAGQAVELRFQYGRDTPRTGTMMIPRSITSSLRDADDNPVELRSSAQILAIDGQEHVTVKTADGESEWLSVTHWRGLRAALREHIDQTVDVRFVDYLSREEHTARMEVTADNAPAVALYRSLGFHLSRTMYQAMDTENSDIFIENVQPIMEAKQAVLVDLDYALDDEI
ncbi:MAG: site-2 protease family protein, partial [Acidobacteria bacterium]|nr:site-2 protease family protein [Acidobacteriota bacterium]